MARLQRRVEFTRPGLLCDFFQTAVAVGDNTFYRQVSRKRVSSFNRSEHFFPPSTRTSVVSSCHCTLPHACITERRSCRLHKRRIDVSSTVAKRLSAFDLLSDVRNVPSSSRTKFSVLDRFSNDGQFCYSNTHAGG